MCKNYKYIGKSIVDLYDFYERIMVRAVSLRVRTLIVDFGVCKGLCAGKLFINY